MERSEDIKELSLALSQAQHSLDKAAKNANNPHYRSRYANLESIWEACGEPLATNGLSVAQLPCDAGDGRIGLETILMHKSGQWIGTKCSVRLTKDDAQGAGSAITYLRRYALASIVGVVASEDDDGNGATQRPQTQQRAPAAKAPAPKAAAPKPKEDLLDDKAFKAAVMNAIKEIGVKPTAKAIGDTLAVDEFGLRAEDSAERAQNRLKFINGIKSKTINFMEN